MKIIKVAKDKAVKALLGKSAIPRGLLDLHQYFRSYTSIHFNFHEEEKLIVATSTNFRYGSIVTAAPNREELDNKIKDAILTSFDVPSSFRQEAAIRRVSEKRKEEYALA